MLDSLVDAVGIEPTTCRLRVAGKPFFTNYYHFPLSAREPLITGPSRVLSLPPVYAIFHRESLVFSPVQNQTRSQVRSATIRSASCIVIPSGNAQKRTSVPSAPSRHSPRRGSA